MARTKRLSVGNLAPAKRRSRNFCFRTQFRNFDATVEFLVGCEQISYKIHKNLATAQSPFFAAALNGHFREAAQNQIKLPDVDAKVFEHVILWLYTQRLEEASCFFRDDKPTYFELLDLYSLADQLCVEGLRNAVVDRIAELAEATNSVPTPMDTRVLYENIRESAPLKRLVLDLFAFKKTDNLIATHPDTWHPEFLRDLVCKLKRPGPAAVARHDLRAWRPVGWAMTKACEVCKVVVRPHVGGSLCVGCDRAICCECVSRGLSGVGGGIITDWSCAERECKPWLTGLGMCAYHEHAETEKCEEEGDSFGGCNSQ